MAQINRDYRDSSGVVIVDGATANMSPEAVTSQIRSNTRVDAASVATAPIEQRRHAMSANLGLGVVADLFEEKSTFSRTTSRTRE
jgi:hypothetical protein